MTRKSIQRRPTQSFAQTVGRMLLIMASLFLAFIPIIAGVLLLLSRGKPKPFVDENGHSPANSISEKVFVTINGIEQGMFIKSKDDKHPVLLYLHGGMPDYFLTQKYPTGLEDTFTVAWWEQRGSGLSYQSITSHQRP